MEFNLSFSTGKKNKDRNRKLLSAPGTTARKTSGAASAGTDVASMLSGFSLGGENVAPRGRDMSRKDPDIAYELNLWIRVAVNKISKAVAAHPIVIETVDPEQKNNNKFKKIISDMRKMLYNPNVMDGYQDFITMLIADLLLEATAATEVTRWVATGEPAEFFPVDVKTIHVNVGKGRVDPNAAYTEIVNGRKGKTLSVKDMIYFRYLPRTGKFIPSSIIAALKMFIAQDGYALKFNLDSLQNGNTIRQIISLGDKDNPIDPEEVAKTQEEWDTKHKGGRTNRRVTFIAGQTITAVPLDATLEDMQWEKLQKYIVRAVAAGFDMPLIYFSWPDETNFANSAAEEKRFAMQTVFPLTVALCDKLNQFWVPQYGVDSMEDIHCIPSPKLAGATELDLAREKKDQETGVLTANEVRERRGDKPNEWGSKYVFNGREFIRIPDEAQIAKDDEEAENPTPEPPPFAPEGVPPAVPPPAANPAPKPGTNPKPATKPPAGQAPEVKPGKKAVSRYANRRREAARVYTPLVRKAEENTRVKLLIAIERAVSRYAAQLKKVPQEDVDGLGKILRADEELKSIYFMDDLSIEELNTEIAAIMNEGYREAIVAANTEGKLLLGETVGAFDVVPQNTLDALNAEFLPTSDKIQFAVNRTANDIVIEGVRAGKSVGQIATDLRTGIVGPEGRIIFHDGTGAYRAYSSTPQNWAEVTAQTNVTHGANSGRLTGWANAGVATKQWFDTGDNRVRPEHRENTAQGPINLQDPFQNGNMFPGEDPACRCDMEIPDTEIDRLSREV